MSKYILSYVRLAFILFVLVVIYLFNNHPVSLVLLILGFVIPCLSVAFFVLFGRKFRASVSFRQSMLNRNANGKLYLKIENLSMYPHSGLSIRFRIINSLGVGEYTHKIAFYVGPYSTEEYELPISFRYCGLFRVELLSISSSDLFDLAGFTKPCEGYSEVVVMPGFAELSGSLDNINGTGSDDDDYTEEHGRGEDRSEIFDIREYAAGDKLQTIHWKLSAKSEQLLVKEFSDLSGEQFQIIVELAYEDNRQMDAFYDLLWTATSYFCKNRIKFSVCYIDGKDSFRRIPIHAEEDIVSLIMQLYYERSVKEEKLSVRRVIDADSTMKNCYLITNRSYSRNEGMTVFCTNQNLARIYRMNG